MEQGPSYTAYMTRCSHQAYPEACSKAVRERLFCVSVYALHWRASPEAAWAYGEDADRYRAGWLCSPDHKPSAWSRQRAAIVTRERYSR